MTASPRKLLRNLAIRSIDESGHIWQFGPVSRNDSLKGAIDSMGKFEARNPKFETIRSDQKTQNSKQTVSRFHNLDLGFSVCFGFRNSDFELGNGPGAFARSKVFVLSRAS